MTVLFPSFYTQFRALAPMYYRGSAAAIIVYDITKEVRYFLVFKCVRKYLHNLTLFPVKKKLCF